MTISSLYQKYKIPPNLIRHHLEVTAVGRWICDHWKGEPIDKELITRALLLHDMGNILKFKRPFLGELEQDAEYWEQVQDEFKETYGSDVHSATITIVNEIGFPAVASLLTEMRNLWFAPPLTVSLEARICEYADCCVTPQGIEGFEARMEDFRQRYHHSNNDSHILSLFKNKEILQKDMNVSFDKLLHHDFITDIEVLRIFEL
jgi:hypothetical protein